AGHHLHPGARAPRRRGCGDGGRASAETTRGRHRARTRRRPRPTPSRPPRAQRAISSMTFSWNSMRNGTARSSAGVTSTSASRNALTRVRPPRIARTLVVAPVLLGIERAALLGAGGRQATLEEVEPDVVLDV